MSTKAPLKQSQGSASSSAPASPTKTSSTNPSKPRHVIGVCALEAKSRSKPMRNILDRLLASNNHPSNPVHFEIVLFTDQLILHDPIEQWPQCDALIAFYSTGFPLEKAIEYQRRRGIFCVNDLIMQYVLQDRRLTQLILEAIDVPTPKRIWLNSSADSPPTMISAKLAEIVSRDFNVDIAATGMYRRLPAAKTNDGIRIGRESLKFPFIEKPANADDHNIWIYHVEGVRKLFRKIANKCSEFVPASELEPIRGLQDTQKSYVFEEFLPVDGGEDVKVYTVGPNYAYAESRKSPFIDGIVRRNAQGKEIRKVTPLTEEEQEIARRVCMAFGQTVCGFDLIRSGGKSYVIDINGWSFVKGSDVYYDKAAKILRDTFIQVARRKRRHSLITGSPSLIRALENDFAIGQWKLKAYVGVFRHADRTPKQKLKLYTSHPEILQFFSGRCQTDEREVILRSQVELEQLLQILEEIDENVLGMSSGLSVELCSSNSAASVPSLEDSGTLASKPVRGLHQVRLILEKKLKVPGTKVQLRQYDPAQADSLQIIVKWGGEFTHAGRHQSKDSGENLRKDLAILNKRILEDVRVFSSNERRVQATAQVFSKAFFPIAELPDNFVTAAPELLDDHLVEKRLFDGVKTKIREHFEDSELVERILSALRRHRAIFTQSFAKLQAGEEPLKRWCCSEGPLLFKERWEKHFADILDAKELDFSRFSDLHDSIRYDAIHHRAFLVQMFTGCDDNSREEEAFQSLLRLFDDLHELFRLATPLEYGFTRGDRLKISKQISGKLLERVVDDLREAEGPEAEPFVRLYFTKETHMHALLNLIRFSGIPLKNENNELPQQPQLTPAPQEPPHKHTRKFSFSLPENNPEDESYPSTPRIDLNFSQSRDSTTIEEFDLDYLSQICFEFYEKVREGRERSYSLRIGVSSGANDAHLFDLQMDAKHAVTVKGRKWITEYLDGDQVLEWLKTLISSE